MIKRILAALLALVLILAFVSCESESPGSSHTRNLLPAEAWYHSYEIYNQWYVAFCLYINVKNDNFIMYRKLAFLGEFQAFFASSKYCGFLLNAFSGLDVGKDDETRNDSVSIDRACDIELFYSKTEYGALLPEEESYFGMTPIDISYVDRSTGMRKLLEGYYGGFVDVDGVRYIYTHGKLQGIKWVHAGYEFTLYVPEEYPLQSTDFFATKMMDPSLAPTAKDAFNRAFDACVEVIG